VVLSLAVAPIAFGPLQFRLGEALKPLVIKYPVTIPAFADRDRDRQPLQPLCRSTGTGPAAGVGVVLTVAAGLPYLAAFASVAVSEVVLLLLGNALLVRRI
jgi:uncharacterized membrane protein